MKHRTWILPSFTFLTFILLAGSPDLMDKIIELLISI